MNPPLLLLLLFTTIASAQPSSTDTSSNSVSFRPSVAIVVGVFSIMFSLTFVILMYAKFCHFNRHSSPSGAAISPSAGFFVSASTFRIHSGIDKTVVDSLPYFLFSSLKGTRHGLECAVCLSKFEDTEILRLLPKCKHAFHIDCVDRWLQSHSTCPLCRHRIHPDDTALFKCSASSRFLFADNQDVEVELYVERESDDIGEVSGRVVTGKEGDAESEEIDIDSDDDDEQLHKFKHRIIVSDVLFKSRWSEVNSSDLISLDTDMLGTVISSGHFSTTSGTSGTGTGTASVVAAALKRNDRCMSEITKVSRFQQGGVKNGDGLVETDEKVRRIWLPIARRTMQWFAGRERRTHDLQEKQQEDANVCDRERDQVVELV